MAIIDAIIWRPDSSGVTYAWRYPETNLSTFTQLVVAESQEALLFSKGRLMGKFGPGKHTLNTENLPVLRSLFGIPFGGKNPFTAEVWFVNKVQSFNIPWRVGSIPTHDIDYNTHIPLRSSGKYGLQIVDAEKFLIKMVGTRSEFTQNDMTSQFSGEFGSRAKSAIVRFMSENRIGFKQVSGYLDRLSDYLCSSMNAFWNEMGVQLTKFYVDAIEIDDSTPEGVAVKEAISRQSSMSITGHTWQQEQMFETANRALDNLGGGNGGSGGILGSLLAINMMGGIGGGGANAAAGIGAAMSQPQYNQPSFGPSDRGPAMPGAPQAMPPHGGGGHPAGGGAPMIYCAQCSHRFPSTSRFCPNCGHNYNPCPSCGSDNLDTARRCVSCGTMLTGAAPGASRCPSCNTPVTPGAQFCPGCGQRLGGDNTCTRCGATLPPGVNFCPNCGQRR